MDNLFDEFDNISKKEWVAKIEKDLKGVSIDSLIKNYDGIIMNPVITSEDLPSNLLQVPVFKVDNDWLIGTNLEVINIKSANAALLEMLTHGVESPKIVIVQDLKIEDISILLEGVEMAFIQPIFVVNEYTVDSILAYLSVNYKLKTRVLKGAIISKSENASKINAVLPCFHTKYISTDSTIEVEELTELFIKIDSALESKIDPKSMIVELKIGSNYLLQIAKLRAIKILIQQLLTRYDHVSQPIFINAITNVQNYSTDINQNMIINSIQAISAVVGGIDRLEICPASDESLSKRTAINIHHLMKMENYLDKIIDPANGSYLIESLTDQLVSNVLSK